MIPNNKTTQDNIHDISAEFIALRTVPIVLKNGNRTMQVNALLDDASTKTYVNANVTKQLELQGTNERVTINVLNGQVKTLETRPIDAELESLTGNVSSKITAYTANRVTGNMSAFDWSKNIQRWPHLKHIKFPRLAKRPIIYLLIGLDCAELHCTTEEVRGRPDEPIA